MCITPSKVWVERGAENWLEIPVPCKRCWRCVSNRVNDYVGRALCEASVSEWTKVITLTYAPRDDGAEILIYPPHFQNFIKLCRRRGLKIRYLACGEYGKRKGRAHFHAILFGSGKQPQITLKDKRPWPDSKNFHTDVWPHGHVFAEGLVTDKSVRYVCKYLQKDIPGQYWFSLSKKPPLGAAFFEKKAKELIEFDLMPHSFEYLPPGGDRGRPYLLTGASRRDYVKAIIAGLKEKGSKKIVNKKGLFSSTFTSLSEWVQTAVEKVERGEAEAEYRADMVANPEKHWEIMLDEFSDDPEIGMRRRVDPRRVLMRQLLEDFERNEAERYG